MTGLLVLAAVFFLTIPFIPQLHTAWGAAATVRRITEWHAENDRAAVEVEWERVLFDSWEREFRS